MHEIFKQFTFDAAHHLAAIVKEGHPCSRLHGHSFTVTVTLRGEPDPKAKWIVDFGEFDKALSHVHDALDHRYLNEIPGLEISTMENISKWIWDKIKPDFPQLYRVSIARGTLGEGCSYQENA
jgi:6-pyruvoyltetrahydropterin/6-carboxytetrahydropterin synthase